MSRLLTFAIAASSACVIFAVPAQAQMLERGGIEVAQLTPSERCERLLTAFTLDISTTYLDRSEGCVSPVEANLLRIQHDAEHDDENNQS